MSKSPTDKNNLMAFMQKTDTAAEEPIPPRQLETASISAAPERRRPKPRTKKTGRPSFKKPDVEYARLSIEVPDSTKELLELARIQSGPHKGKQQAVIVDEALRAYLKPSGR